MASRNISTGTVRWLLAGALVFTGWVTAGSAAAWTLSLRESVDLPPQMVRLADIVDAPVPDTAGVVVVASSRRPGDEVVVDRRSVLRRLSAVGLADEVVCAGAERCRIIFAGEPLALGEVAAGLQSQLQAWLPISSEQAPPAWLEVELAPVACSVGEQWRLELVKPRPLVPGRNLVAVKVIDAGRALRLTATVLCHAYDEVAVTKHRVRKDEPLHEDDLTWEWQDLCRIEHGIAVGRPAIAGMAVTRELQPGQLLRQADLKSVPMVRQGEPVELRLCRGRVAVTVRALSRQDGGLGQVVTVRNELNGRLITGRVAGPGLVEARR